MVWEYFNDCCINIVIFIVVRIIIVLTLSYRKSACVVFHLKYLLVKTDVWCAYVELVQDVKIFAYILLAIYYTKFI